MRMPEAGETVLGFTVVKKIGYGKASVSYLVSKDDEKAVLKVMHGKPYDNGHVFTVEDELKAYDRLCAIGVDVPKMIAFDKEEGILLKVYVEGPTASELIARGDIRDDLYPELFESFLKIESLGSTIDYFPANFVLSQDRFIYIDYEINPLEEAWNFSNWGIFFWFAKEGFARYVSHDHDHSLLVDSKRPGHPLKELTAPRAEAYLMNHPLKGRVSR